MNTIIFDFDGTIADSLETVIGIYRELTGDKRPLDKTEVDELRKLTVPQLVKAIGVPLWRVPALLTRGRKMMLGHLEQVTTFPGLPEVLAELHARGYTMHIVSSNSQSNVEAFLERHELRAYFGDIIGSVGLLHKAKTLKTLVASHKLTSAETWYVGDEARDVTAAKKAGLRVVSVAWGYQHIDLLKRMKPTALAETPEELLHIVTQ